MVKRMRQPKGGQRRRMHVGLVVLLALAAVACMAGGAVYAWDELKRVWQEQCRVEDIELDVVVTGDSKMVPAEVVPIIFNLTNGVNLAEVDFAKLRVEALKRYPAIRDIRIERRMPNGVLIDVKERMPVVRVAGQSPRVADEEGVVFRLARNVAMLPLVREDATPPTPPGERLKGNAAAAVQLVCALSEKEYPNLGVLEADATHADWLLVTLAESYSRAKIAWNRMGEKSRRSAASLAEQLSRLDRAIATRMAPNAGTTQWVATDWEGGRIYASDPANLNVPERRKAK